MLCKHFFENFFKFLQNYAIGLYFYKILVAIFLLILYNLEKNQMEKHKMKKYQSNLMITLFFIAIFIIILLNSLFTSLNPYDETWNFQSIFKMYQGGTLYVDNNVIDTPLFFVLGNLLFRIFGANLLIFRIYGTFLFFIKYLFMFFILRKLGSSKLHSILYLSLWLTIDSNNFSCGANYNQLALIMCFVGILWYITHYHKKFYHLGQGILIFLTFFTKQNIGVYYAFGICLFELLEHGLNRHFFANQFAKLASFLPCLLISFVIMYLRGNFFGFINLCFGSLFEFGSSNRVFNKNTLPYLISMLFISIFGIYLMVNSKISQMLKRNIKFLLCLAIGLSFILLPIINPYHTVMSVTFYYLAFVYMIDHLILQEIFYTKAQKYTLLLICVLIFSAIFAKTVFLYFKESPLKYFDKTHPFYNAPISGENLTRINDITNYIVEKKKSGTDVIILSYEAAVYMVPLHINNGAFDMLLAGNLGYHGISNTIDKIANSQNTEFLIFTNEDDCFYQEPTQIREYILNHLEKNGEFLDYSIYINK